MTDSSETQEIRNCLMAAAQERFGAEHSAELQAEIGLMAEQLTMLRATPVDLQDEP